MPSARRSLHATGLAWLFLAGSALAAPVFQALPNPASVGSVFSLHWTDSSTDPATGFTGLEVLITFDASTLEFVGALAGSAFGNSTTSINFDVFPPPGDDLGFASLQIAQTLGSQRPSFGSDILRVDFRAVAEPLSGSATPVNFLLPLTPGTPGPNDYTFPESGLTSTVLVTPAVMAVPEPGSGELMVAALGVPCDAHAAAPRCG